MKRKSIRRFGELCLDCGFISYRDVFRCKRCNKGNIVEVDYIDCPTVLKGCKEKVIVGDLPVHLAVCHPHEMAQFYCEKVLKIYEKPPTKYQIEKHYREPVWKKGKGKSVEYDKEGKTGRIT